MPPAHRGKHADVDCPCMKTHLTIAALGAALLLSAAPRMCPAQPGGAAMGETMRTALAQAYLRVDRLTSAREFTGEQRAEINRAFDRTTLQFFMGQYATAIGGLDSLLRALGGDDAAVEKPLTGRERWVEGQSPSAVASRLRQQLGTVDSTGSLSQARAAAMSRVGLLTDEVSTTRSIEMLINPRAHAAAVTREVDALLGGINPYMGRSGDWWREIVTGAGSRVPVRVIAPPSAVPPARSAPVPLVIALHGAGGDENMFVDAYGAGVLTRLADSLGFLVVSPLANGFSAQAFDSVLSVVSREYRVDADRVYVIGHSMGAGITAALANARGARLAAVALLAGGAPIRDEASPPALFVGAQLDPIIRATLVKASADATAAAGRTSEYRELANEGHTLMVGRAVPDAIAWLFQHTRAR